MPARVISSNGDSRIVSLFEDASFYYQNITMDQKLAAFTPDLVFLQSSATDWDGETSPTRDFCLTHGEMDDLIKAYQVYQADGVAAATVEEDLLASLDEHLSVKNVVVSRKGEDIFTLVLLLTVLVGWYLVASHLKIHLDILPML